MRRFLTTIGPLIVFAGLAAAAPPELLEPFLDQHCFDCHDSETSKGDLDLSALDFDTSDLESLSTWMAVYKRVRVGEMPPKKKKQPPADEKEAFLKSVAKPILAVELERQQKEGRVVLRRLNRTEYENTLRDLLALPHLNVREMLPADAEAHGFDTVGEALNLSYVQMTKYLEAADIAIGQAIGRELARRRGAVPNSNTVRKTGADIGRFRVKNGEVQHLGNTRIILRQPNSAQTPWRLTPLVPKVDGQYRIRTSLYGLYWNDGKIKPADRLHVVSLYADSGMMRRNLGTFDIANNRGQVNELTVQLSAGDQLIVHFDALDDRNGAIRNKKRGLPYSGPGIAVEWLELEGPLPPIPPPKNHQLLFGDLPVKKWTADSGLREPDSSEFGKAAPPVVVAAEPEADAADLLQKFMTRALRRPVAAEEVEPYMPLVRDKFAQKHTFQEAMRTGFKAVLCSPDFLFFKESPGRLDGHALASRLSYFLWKSMPDAELIALAAKGELSKPDVLRSQTERLLSDPRSARFVDDFLDQWLELGRIGFTEPDKQLYPEFTELLQNSMVAETRAFFDAMLRENLGADHLVQSDFTFLNGMLAELYGVPGIEGTKLRKVTLPPDSPRGGFLTQGSVLKVTANGTTTSLVTRGVWIVERLLGGHVPPPPPGAGSIDPDVRGTTTVREQLAKHSADASCATCHQKIDPPGFALESFDVMGGWRDRYRSLENGDKTDAKVHDEPVKYKLGPAVDASGQTPEGKAFKDIAEFRAILLDDREQLARSLSERLMVYATGAGIGFADQAEIERIISSTQEDNYGTRSLVHAIIQSATFQSK